MNTRIMHTSTNFRYHCHIQVNMIVLLNICVYVGSSFSSAPLNAGARSPARRHPLHPRGWPTPGPLDIQFNLFYSNLVTMFIFNIILTINLSEAYYYNLV